MTLRALRLSFAVARLGVWAFALGCGETNGGAAPGSPATGCPVTAPLQGSACDAEGACAYPGVLDSAPCSPAGFKATCADGHWQLAANQFIGCNTIFACPLPGPPPDGEMCVVTGVVCTYNEGPCKETVRQCVSAAWKTTQILQTDCGEPLPQPSGGASGSGGVPTAMGGAAGELSGGAAGDTSEGGGGGAP
jgi:hypothetical protein